MRTCLQVVERTGARLMIGFNRRFDSEFKALRAQIEAGTVGEVELVQITSRDHAPPPIDYIRRSGGIFRDMMIHDLDMARFLVGEEFVEVFATGSVLIDPAFRSRRRCRHGDGNAEDRERQDRGHHHQPPRQLWPRPAGRGAWLEGHGLDR